jgi:hypothetical protein
MSRIAMSSLAARLLCTAVVLTCAMAPDAACAGAKGALTSFGSKWGWTGTDEAFVPQLVMYATPDRFYGQPGKIDADIRTFLGEHGFNGFHVFVACRWFDLEEVSCANIEGTDPSFDRRTFEALEMLIRKTHAAGGMVHIWLWGDEERGWTASSRADWGGQMGSVERRLLDEIARRLGPLDGWSMGYGFDLDEWVTADGVRAWRDYLQARLPEFRFLGGRPDGPNRGTDHAAQAAWNEGLDYASYEHHKPSYEVYVAALEASAGQPVLSEDRFRVWDGMRNPDQNYTLEGARRGLWLSTMAGGVANIWGYLEDGGSHDGGSAPFPNAALLKTYARFFEGRFKNDVERCNDLAEPDVLCLKRPTRAHYIFYSQDTDAMRLDLSQMRGVQPIVAVDTRAPYHEIGAGMLAPGVHLWQAPHRSDWAIAVGAF